MILKLPGKQHCGFKLYDVCMKDNSVMTMTIAWEISGIVLVSEGLKWTYIKGHYYFIKVFVNKYL